MKEIKVHIKGHREEIIKTYVEKVKKEKREIKNEDLQELFDESVERISSIGNTVKQK